MADETLYIRKLRKTSDVTIQTHNVPTALISPHSKFQYIVFSGVFNFSLVVLEAFSPLPRHL